MSPSMSPPPAEPNGNENESTDTTLNLEQLRARALRAKTQSLEGWERIRQRVGAQASQGAEWAQLKRSERALQREVEQHTLELGRLTALAFTAQGSPISVEGELATAIGALADASTALADVTERAQEIRQGRRSRG